MVVAQLVVVVDEVAIYVREADGEGREKKKMLAGAKKARLEWRGVSSGGERVRKKKRKG